MKSLPLRSMGIAFGVLLFPAILHAQQTQPVWPRQITTPAGAVTFYQPQVDSFNQVTLTFHAAVSLTPTGQSAPIFGAMWFSANVQTDREARTVTLLNLTVTNSRFPNVDQSTVDAVSAQIGQDAPNTVLSLDQLLAAVAKTQQQQTAAANLNTTPPKILFVDYPAVLVSIDGSPQLSPVPNTSFMRVVNTPFFIVLDPSTSTYYLNGAGQWVSAPDVMGPWQTAQNVPKAIKALAPKQAAAQGDDQTVEQSTSVPTILVATVPTELIQTDGPEQFGTIDGTSLLYVSNTQSDVFMNISTQNLYVLLSGRWYTATTQNGPWTFVPPNQLPPDFTNIPPTSPKADVLASVAGTQMANNAVLDASVPQTAAVKVNAPGPDVKYDGDPKFQPVEGTSLQYAVNTSHAVVQVQNTYYCCADGIWYVADGATGPWTVALNVPDVVYTIPPTNPIYNVTYCRVYNSTPDVVYCGYLPGYLGSYAWGGTVVYGTGWPYQPWVGNVFIPRPVTWGFGAIYNPYSFGWGFGVGFGAGFYFGSTWNHGWWGPGGYRSYNNNNVTINRNVTNNFNNTTNNIYNRTNNANRVVQNNTINNTRVNNNANRVNNVNTDRQNRINEANRAAADNPANRAANTARSRNDVYAGADGNVYRNSLDGWQRHDNGNWNSVNRSADHSDFDRNVKPQLNSDFSARNYGGDREFHGGGGGGYRGGGGGGARGGGGRR